MSILKRINTVNIFYSVWTMSTSTVCSTTQLYQCTHTHIGKEQKIFNTVLNKCFSVYQHCQYFFQCMDNVHFNGLFYNTMPNASSTTIPQCVKSDPNLFKDDAEIRFSKTFNNCKVIISSNWKIVQVLCFTPSWLFLSCLHILSRTHSRGRIFSRVRPFYERAVSDLDRSMHRSLWA